MSRTANSAKNIITINLSKILTIVLSFVVRTVLIRTLGTEYLGIGNLFTNILQLMSLAELGVGTAIIFKLYKPIEVHNEDRIIALMKLYKRVYQIIGWIVVAMGVIIAPFLPHIIQDFNRFSELNLNPYFIFGLYVFNSASSYWFFAYKQAIVTAHQKTYLMTIYSYAINILSSVVQIIILITLKNFILYTVAIIFFNIILNFIYAWIADRKYPYIKKRTDEKISKEEIKDLIKDCGALLLYKMNSAVVSATDNIIISAYIGLSAVGLFSNYSMISYSIRQIIASIINSLSASIGSINATGKIEWKRKVFHVVNFATVLIYGIISIGIVVMMDDFMVLWLGKDYLINSFTINSQTYHYSLPLFFGIEVYIMGYVVFLANFRQSFGLFRQLKWRPLFSMIINLAIGLSTTKFIGPVGTVLGTIIAYSVTTLIYDPIVIINNSLEFPVKKYFFKNAFYALITLVAGFTSYYTCSLISGEGVMHFAIKGCVCVLTSAVVYFLFVFKTKDFKLLLSFFPNVKALDFLR